MIHEDPLKGQLNRITSRWDMEAPGTLSLLVPSDPLELD